MTKQYVDLVIRMFYPEKKEDAKDYCMTGLKESLKKRKISKAEFEEMKEYILSR